MYILYIYKIYMCVYIYIHTHTLNKREKKVVFYNRMPANEHRRNKS